MPLLHVEVVDRPDDPTLAQRLVDAAGEALGAEPGRTWVRLHGVAREDYAEHGGAPPDDPPVFVELVLGLVPDGPELEALVGRLTDAVAGEVGRTRDRVHVVVAPPGAGRVAFGGRVVPPAG